MELQNTPTLTLPLTLPHEIIIEIIKHLRPTMKVLLVSSWFTDAIFEHCIESHTIYITNDSRKFVNARNITVTGGLNPNFKINPCSLTLSYAGSVSTDTLIAMSRLTSLDVSAASFTDKLPTLLLLTNLRALSINGSHPLDGLNITDLTLVQGNPSPINMSSLRKLTLGKTSQAPKLINVQLNYLWAIGVKIPESYKASTRNLTALIASWSQIPSGDFMNLTRLEFLNSSGMPGSVIKQLTTLKHLSITRSNITSYDLRGLMLHSLDFQVPETPLSCTHMTDLNALLTCGNAVQDVDIKHLTSLRRLHLGGFPNDKSQVTDAGIKALTRLLELRIANNDHITNHGISHLKLLQLVAFTNSRVTSVESIYRYRDTYDGSRGDIIIVKCVYA